MTFATDSLLEGTRFEPLVPPGLRSWPGIGFVAGYYYFPRMQADETVLIRCFASAPAELRVSAHTGFDDPTSPPDATPRESLEVRTLVFFRPEA